MRIPSQNSIISTAGTKVKNAVTKTSKKIGTAFEDAFMKTINNSKATKLASKAFDVESSKLPGTIKGLVIMGKVIAAGAMGCAIVAKEFYKNIVK